MENAPTNGAAEENVYARRSVVAAGTLGLIGGLGVVPRSAKAQVAATLQGVFNVRDFGANGNGSNDTAAIQAAIDAASAARHGIVYFPPADPGSAYLISAPLTIHKPIKIVGAGPSAVTIWAHNFTLGQFVFDFDCAAVDVVQHLEMSGLTVRSNNGQPSGIRIKNAAYFLLKNLVTYGVSDGVVLTGTRTFSISFEQFTAYLTGRYGVLFNGVEAGHYSFVSSTFDGNTGVVIDTLSGVNNVSFVNCNFEQCYVNSFYAGGTVLGLSFTGCRTEGCDGDDFQINPVLGKLIAGLSITGCFFTSDNGASSPVRLGGAGGRVRGFNICGNCVGYAGGAFVHLNGEGESGIIAGNYFSGASMTPTNVYRAGVHIFGNENATTKSPETP